MKLELPVLPKMVTMSVGGWLAADETIIFLASVRLYCETDDASLVDPLHL